MQLTISFRFVIAYYIYPILQNTVLFFANVVVNKGEYKI